MITSLNGASEKIPAPTRTGHDDILKRRDAGKAATVAFESQERESAVVDISSEGARRAQAREQEQRLAVAAQQLQGATSSATPSATSSATPVSVLNSNSAPAIVQLPSALTQLTPEASTAAAQAANNDLAALSEFDEADANQDGTVNVLEKRAFEFMHPTLERYPGAEEDPLQHTVAAELKAYEAVARGGRNL